MSDEHKPHDDHAHGHDDHSHDDHAHGHDDHAHGETHKPNEHAHDHAAHDAHGHAEPISHQEGPIAAAHAHDDGHHDHGHDAHGHETPADHADHSHATHDDHGPAVADHGQAHDDHGHAAPVAAAAVAGATAAAATHKPVWSDKGDAPFEDVDSTPVYARGGKRRAKSGGGEGFEIVKTILFALLIALVLRVILFQPFTIPSASMEPNLYEGDYIVVSKWSYGWSKHSIPFSPPLFEGRIMGQQPKRGDIVVFKLPRDNKTDYIKRLIGLPGDKVQMIDNTLYINGQPVRDAVLSRQAAADMYGMSVTRLRETFPDNSKTFTIQDFGPGNALDDTPVFEVPEGYYFMMGDNRDNSVDSRVDPSSGVGLVPYENLIGKAQIIMFSWSPGASLWNPVSWFANVRPSRFFTVLD